MQQLLVLRTSIKSLEAKADIVIATHQNILKHAANKITIEDAISMGYRLMGAPLGLTGFTGHSPNGYEWWLERDIDN
jgi:hypothetical protein